MADLMPDYHLQQYKMNTQIAQLQMNLARAREEIVEHRSREATARNNIQSTKEAIADCRERLAGLVKEHGKAPEVEELDNG